MSIEKKKPHIVKNICSIGGIVELVKLFKSLADYRFSRCLLGPYCAA